MTTKSLRQFIMEEHGDDVDVVLSCENRYEINKKLTPGEDHRGERWTTPAWDEWRCPRCVGADGLYFLTLEDITMDGKSVFPKGGDL